MFENNTEKTLFQTFVFNTKGILVCSDEPSNRGIPYSKIETVYKNLIRYFGQINLHIN